MLSERSCVVGVQNPSAARAWLTQWSHSDLSESAHVGSCLIVTGGSRLSTSHPDFPCPGVSAPYGSALPQLDGSLGNCEGLIALKYARKAGQSEQ
jgi:hypothetical protein